MDIDNSIISINLIQQAINYYQAKNYNLIDVPMCVPEYIMRHNTEKFVKNKDLNYINNLKYVASAEQSFLYLKELKKINYGKYMALSPCYRDNEPDSTHFKIFLKLELIIIGKHDYPEIISDAIGFFSFIEMNDLKIQESEEKDIWDINSKGIELGSYGNRYFIDGEKYSFGTGIAEPRTSYVKNKE